MAESRSRPNLLNRAQRNSVGILLREFEMRLRHMSDDLTRSEQGALYEIAPAVSADALAAIRVEIALSLKEISGLAESLGLNRVTEPMSAVLMGELTVFWSDLYDVRADKLTRYGEVAPELSEVLNPPVMRLIRHVETMMRQLRKNNGESESSHTDYPGEAWPDGVEPY